MNSSRQKSGGKAAALAELREAGFYVPQFEVIPVSVFKHCIEELLTEDAFTGGEKGKVARTEIREQISKLHLLKQQSFLLEIYNKISQEGTQAVAVRSSATLEDGGDHSFAGQFMSLLNIASFESFTNAVKEVWQSVFKENVFQYCLQRHVDFSEAGMAVIVQQMVSPDFSGVLFTLAPLEKSDTYMCLESVSGLGDKLLSGETNPAITTFDWRQKEIIRCDAGIQGNMASGEIQRKLFATGLELQLFYGRPQDVEWAVKNGEIFILQSRPITQIQLKSDTEWTNADFKDGGISSAVTTPMIWSLYNTVLHGTMPSYLKNLHIYPKQEPESWGRYCFGIGYWNLSAVKEGLRRIPGFTERQFDEDLGIDPDYEGLGWKTPFNLQTILQGLRILFATRKSIKNRISFNAGLLRKYKTEIKGWHDFIQSRPNSGALYKKIIMLVEEVYFPVESAYFLTIYDNSNCKTLFSENLEKHAGKIKAEISYPALVSGIGDIPHLKPLEILSDMAIAIKSTQSAEAELSASNLKDKFLQEKLPFQSEIRDLLNDFGYHSPRELDLLSPSWDEDPKQIFDMLYQLLSTSERIVSVRVAEQEAKAKEEASKIKSAKLKKQLQEHRELLWWREQMRDLSRRIYDLLRKYLLKGGAALMAEAKLDEAEDIFFLPWQDVKKLLQQEEPMDYRQQIFMNKQYRNSFRNFPFPNQIKVSGRNTHKKVVVHESPDYLSGVGCSPGIFTGTIQVLTSVEDIDQLKQDVILVTKFTDPSWTGAFASIRGIITETGGMLSHGAVVSREFGIPAVLAVKDACSRLKNGMEVEIDGYTGTVKILHKAKL